MKENGKQFFTSLKKPLYQKLWSLLGGLLLALQGCSLLSSKTEVPNVPQADAEFAGGTISPVANPVPVPIEVAAEMSEIMQGRVPPPSTSYPTVFAENPAPETLQEEAKVKQPKPESKPEPKLRPKVQSRKIAQTGPSVSYQVRRGDTLMKIAFEKYANVYRWREIYDSNKRLIQNFNALVPGTVLTLHNVEYIVIERNGKPYLIRKNDTLVKISRWLYGTPVEWKSLWSNNRQLIHDPNKIYAGFTLYYQPKESLIKPSLLSSPNRQIENRKPATTPIR